MGKSTTKDTDYSFSLTVNLSSAVVVATIFVLTSFVVIGTVLGEWKGVADKLSDLAIGLIIVFIGVPIALRINRQSKREEDNEERASLCKGLHHAFAEIIEVVDQSVRLYAVHLNPSFSPYVSQFDYTFTRRISLIEDKHLNQLIDRAVHELKHLAEKLQFLRTISMTNLYQSNYASTVQIAIGETLRQRIPSQAILIDLQNQIGHEMISNEFIAELLKRHPEFGFTNEGVNADCIAALNALQEYMKTHSIAFDSWSPERILAVGRSRGHSGIATQST